MPSPSKPPLPNALEPSDESGSLVLRFGTALGVGAAGAMACTVPAVMRLTAVLGAEATSEVWTGLAAAALVPMIVTVFVLRGAREGLRAFGGPDADLVAYGAALWALWLLVALAGLGSALRATTHHHALAGVTFAFGALALAVGIALVAVRAVEILRAAGVRTRRLAAIVLGGVSVASLAAIGMRFLRAASQSPDSAPAAGAVVDVLAFALLAGLGAQRTLASRRLLALVGPPVAVAIVALGVSALRDSSLRSAIDDRAPAFAALIDEMPRP